MTSARNHAYSLIKVIQYTPFSEGNSYSYKASSCTILLSSYAYVTKYAVERGQGGSTEAGTPAADLKMASEWRDISVVYIGNIFYLL